MMDLVDKDGKPIGFELVSLPLYVAGEWQDIARRERESGVQG